MYLFLNFLYEICLTFIVRIESNTNYLKNNNNKTLTYTNQNLG